LLLGPGLPADDEGRKLFEAALATPHKLIRNRCLEKLDRGDDCRRT